MPTFTHICHIICIEVWGWAPKCPLNSLFLVQQKILIIMTFSPYLAHTDPLFKDLKNCIASVIKTTSHSDI